MAFPIIDMNSQIWYSGYTSKHCTIPFDNVYVSYNLDTLMRTMHPHEKDYVLAKVKGFNVPAPEDEEPSDFYAFMQPVLDERLFFNRESFIRTPVALRRVRLVQMFDPKTMFTARYK